MIASIRSELRKLLSVRSTYILVMVALALVVVFAYFGTSANTYEEAVCESTGEVLYGRGQTDARLDTASPEEVCGGEVSYSMKTVNDLPKEKLLFNLQETMPVIAMFIAIIVVLQMGHEFRYNTINYTLTTSSRRSKVLLSKITVNILFTVIVTLLAIGVSVIVTHIAINLKGLTLPAQDYDWLYILVRHAGYALAYALFYLGTIVLVRNLIAGVIAIFLLPTIDGIGGLLLALGDIEPTRVLPFSALDRFGNVAADVASISAATVEFADIPSNPATMLGAGAVFAAYLIGLWVIAWLLFVRRDV